MLTHIYIQNFTIIDQFTLDLENGLSVLTGETGAGKSIWVDAVSLALGARSDSSIIRHGQSRCEITLCFNVKAQPQAQQWLVDHDYNEENECVIRRIITKDTASRASINGRPCTLTLLRELGALLIHTHSQHQHQRLLKREAQQITLDTLGEHGAWLHTLRNSARQWTSLETQRKALKERMAQQDREREFLHYQLDELIAAHLQDNEWETLTKKHQKLHHTKDLLMQLNQALTDTVDGASITASQLLQNAIDQLDAIKYKETQTDTAKNLLETALIHVQEAGHELQQYRHQLDLNPDVLTQIEERLTTLHDLARKHHVNPENLLETQHAFEEKLQQLDHLDIELTALEKTQKSLEADYQKIAKKLTQSRKKIASSVNKTITERMQSLGITGGVFKVALHPHDERMQPQGLERVEFHVSTNPGQPCQPLSTIVSGGELSRISLALQIMLSQKEAIPTLIFDEVDTGIGGHTAEVVGALLRELGTQTQVLCITHLPQVAGQGHHHYKVTKTHKGDQTRTSVTALNKSERIEELARMLSGSNISPQMRAHASELLG